VTEEATLVRRRRKRLSSGDGGSDSRQETEEATLVRRRRKRLTSGDGGSDSQTCIVVEGEGELVIDPRRLQRADVEAEKHVTQTGEHVKGRCDSCVL
jgi:hypothetical protein